MQREARPRTKRLWPRLALSTGAMLFALLVLELVFRLAGIKAEFHGPIVDQAFQRPGGPLARAIGGTVPLATFRTTYPSDPRGYLGPGCYVDYKINSAGFRDVEHTILKPSHVYRILGLGDSYLYGQGVRYDDICLTQLERQLNERAHHVEVETINTGILARNTEHELAVLRMRGLRYRPDLVILHFVLNDVERGFDPQASEIDFFEVYTRIYLEPDFLSRYSYLWSWARQRWLRDVRARRFIREIVSDYLERGEAWQRCEAALDGIRAACQENGVPLLIVVFPFFHELDGDYPFQPIHDQLHEYAESRGQPLIDLRESYRDYSGPELWVHPTDQHPNETAHRIAAEAVADYIEQHAEELGFDQFRGEPGTLNAALERRMQAETRVVQLGGMLTADRTSLAFYGQPIADVDLNLLADGWPEFDQVETLVFAETEIGDATLSRLDALPKLRTLDLTGTNVSDAAVERFRQTRPDVELKR